MLTQLTNDVAKLKAKGAIDFLPKNELTLLINFAMRNIDVSRNLSAGPVSNRLDTFRSHIYNSLFLYVVPGHGRRCRRFD